MGNIFYLLLNGKFLLITLHKNAKYINTMCNQSRHFTRIMVILMCVFTILLQNVSFAQTKAPKFKKIVLSDKFNAEGSCIGDFNKDGIPDVAIGHYWYEGPDFKKRHQFFDGPDAKDFDPVNYSECFGMFAGDFNGDGWDDILVCPHPGQDGFWYENQKNGSGMWKKHPATVELGNESWEMADIFGSGKKSLLFNRNGYLGLATPNPGRPNDPWDFIAISNKDNRYHKYTHGAGYGDITGNGKMDIIERIGWWEQPVDPKTTPGNFMSLPSPMLQHTCSFMMLTEMD